MLSTIIFLPLIGALLALLVPRSQPGLARMVAMGAAVATFVVSLVMLIGSYDQSASGLQLFEIYSWIPAWGVEYNVAIDGISVWLVMLTTFMTPLAIWSAWNVEHKPNLFMA